MSAFIDFYQDEQSIKQSLIEGCSDSKTANSVFEVLVKAELFLCSLYFREESNFNNIYDSALKMAKTLKENVSYSQLLVSKALYQVTLGARGRTMELLSKSRDIETLCSSVSVAYKGKRLCYKGIYRLVNGHTEIGVELLEWAVSLMSGSQEESIFRIIAVQILATYYRFKNDPKRMLEFCNRSLEDCKATGNKELLIIPTDESTGKKKRNSGKEMTQQPLKFQIDCLVSEAVKHLKGNDTMRSITDAAQKISKDIKKSSLHSSLGLFMFQCNVNITLRQVLKNFEESKQWTISFHERAVNQVRQSFPSHSAPSHSAQSHSEPSHSTITTDEQFTRRRGASLPWRKKFSSLGKAEIENHQGTTAIFPIQSAQSALGISLELSGEQQSSTADSYHALGGIQHELALQSTRRALDKLLGEEHSSTADSYNSLGDTQHALGDFSSAFESTQRALDTRLKLFGEEHKSIADSYHSLGVTHDALGDFSSALQSTQRALDIRLKLFGEEHSSTADSYHSLGVTHDARGDFWSALQSTQRALGIRLKLFGEKHQSTADSYHLLGVTYSTLGDFSSALQSTQRALDIRLLLLWRRTLKYS